jgi:3-hydroxybutyryl-CoA dehydrogenase
MEVIRTIVTSDEAVKVGRDFSQSLGKTTIIARDAPCFIVNRLLVPQLLSAIGMLEDGVATREDIDTGLTLGLGHPIGPLALSDLVGLDTLLFIANSTYNEFKDPQFAPPVLLAKMVAAGWLGRKTGKGFYDYK